MTAPELKVFHLGIVVRELAPVMERYRGMLGVELWRVREPLPNGITVAYGRGAGQTWELIEVPNEGTTQFHEFFARHGEGVQHVGIWTPDMRASLETALAAGAKFVSSTTDEAGNTTVQLIPGDATPPPDLDNLERVAYVEAGFGGVRMEYIGQIGEAFLRDWLKDVYNDMVPPPPWQEPP